MPGVRGGRDRPGGAGRAGGAGPRMRRCRVAPWSPSSGQGLVELVIGLPLLLLLLLGSVQVGLFYQAKSTLTLAAFEAARAGSLHHARESALRAGLAQGLLPLYSHTRDAAGLARARVLAQAAARTARIELLNPTPAAFADFAMIRAGVRQLPNDNLARRPATLGAQSGESLQDANLLKLRITYGYPLPVPLVGPLILRALRRLDPDPGHQALLAQGRLPLVATATVRMQSPVEWQAAFQTPGGTGTGAGNTGGAGTGQPGAGTGGGGAAGNTRADGAGTPGTPLAPPPGVNNGAVASCGATDPGTEASTPAPLPSSTVGNPIRLATGNKYQAETDLPPLPGPLSVSFTRHYNSQAVAGGMLGSHWRHSYEATLRRHGAGWRLLQADGRVIDFTPGADGRFRPLLPSDGVLRVTPTGLQRLRPDGIREDYDRAGRLLALGDAQGQRLQLTYQAGRLVAAQDPWGRRLRFAYDPAGRLATLSDPAGAVYRYAYDARGRLAAVQGPAGYARRYAYADPRHPQALTGITDGRGIRIATWGYDAAGRAVASAHAGGVEAVRVRYVPGEARVTDAQGQRTAYRLAFIHGLGVTTAVVGPGCTPCHTADVTYAYNNHAQLTAVRDARGVSTRYTYDAAGRLSSVTEAAGTASARTTVYRYAGARLLGIAWPSVWPGHYARLSLHYTPSGLPDRLTATGYTPAGQRLTRTLRYGYDARQRLSAVDGPLPGPQDTLQFAYDAQGRPVRLTLPDGRSVRILAYDAYGRPQQVQALDGERLQLRYGPRGALQAVTDGTRRLRIDTDPDGRPLRVQLPDGTRWQAVYDAAGRLTALRDPYGNRQTVRYDADDHVRSRALYAPGARTPVWAAFFAYDAGGHRISRRDLSGAETRYTYRDGQLRAVIDPLGRVTQLYADPRGRLSAVWRAGNTSLPAATRLAYDAGGALAQVITPDGLRTRRASDDFGQLRTEQRPTGETLRFDYDAAGRLIARHDGNGLTRYTYDPAGPLRRVAGPGGIVRYRYQGTRLLQVTDPVQQTRYRYDTAGRVTARTVRLGGHRFTTRTLYDALGRPRAEILPDGQRLALHYTAGRLTRLTLDGRPLTTLRYGPLGLTARADGNGLVTRYTYDAAGRLSALDTAPVQRLDYRYDAAGRVTARARNGQWTRYTYDPLDQLIAAQGPAQATAWTYDAAGRRLSVRRAGVLTRYTYDAAGRLSARQGRTRVVYRYDAQGRPLQIGTRRYVYDAAGRPRAVYDGARRLVRYAYNGLGLRVQKTVYPPHQPPRTTWYLYAHGRLVGEADAHGRLTVQYLYLGNQPLARLAGPRVDFILPDALGTPRAMTDAHGQVVWAARYTAFGRATVTVARVPLPLRFPGQYADAETGTYYNTFRDYDPATGRYLTPDPLGLAGGTQAYAYVDNNPLAGVDPWGLSPSDPEEEVGSGAGEHGHTPGMTPAGPLVHPIVPPLPRPGDVSQHRPPLVPLFPNAAGSPFTLKGTLQYCEKGGAKGGKNYVEGYRAVSKAEADDIAKHGFRPDPSGRSMQDKWFSETRQGAEQFRKTYPDLQEVVKTKVPRDVYDRSFKHPNIDNTGPGFCVQCADLSRLPKP